MSDEEYDSFADRQKAGDPRIHRELTETARDRLFPIISNPARLSLVELQKGVPDSVIERAFTTTSEDVGYSEIREYQHEMKTPFAEQKQLIMSADTDTVLTYIENLLYASAHKNGWGEWSNIPIPTSDGKTRHRVVVEHLPETVEKINVVLETECILWEIEIEGEDFHFMPIGSEMLESADENFISITQGEKWRKVASPYNAAYELYAERKYGYEIPEKLYNSIEELARTICVDLEGWEDNREQNLSVYLETMRSEGLFEPNNIMKEELKDLTKSMEKTFQKAGAERKNRHSEIDREYATLLLHQVSAYLTYLIRQYEEKYSKNSESDESV